MNKAIFFVLYLTLLGNAFAQFGNYLYVVPPTQARRHELKAKYESAYSVRVVQPFGEEGVTQGAGCVYGLSHRINLSAAASTIQDANFLSSAQLELMADLYTSPDSSFTLAIGGGWLREYQGVHTIMSRMALGYEKGRWGIHGNLLLQRPFAENRDAVDLLTSIGTSYSIRSKWRAGVEAVGEDLEGFFEKDEAEGGAKLLVSPFLQFLLNQNIFLRMGGGPVFYMTRSSAISDAPRVLPALPDRYGFIIRVSGIYVL
jgi:hypothetical protein